MSNAATLAELDKEVKEAGVAMRAFSGTDVDAWYRIEARFDGAVKAWASKRAEMGPSAREKKAIARANRGWID